MPFTLYYYALGRVHSALCVATLTLLLVSVVRPVPAAAVTAPASPTLHYVRCAPAGCLTEGFTRFAASTGAILERRTCLPAAQGGCSEGGWVTELPGGADTLTACLSPGCHTAGAVTTTLDGAVHTKTVCTAGDCARQGWATYAADGTPISVTRCQAGDCAGRGWDTFDSSGTQTTAVYCESTATRSCVTEGYVVVEEVGV